MVSSGSLQTDLLNYLDTHDELNTWAYANEHQLDHQQVTGTIRRIQTMADVMSKELNIALVFSLCT